MKYMLMMHTPRDVEGGVLSWPPEDVKNMIEYQHQLDREITEAGEMVINEGLTWPDEARIVRADANGAPVVTDGPFPESKEFLIGFWIVDVATPQRAYEIAAKASATPGVGGEALRIPIEVRPVGSAPPTDS
jgi:hypothetical protein